VLAEVDMIANFQFQGQSNADFSWKHKLGVKIERISILAGDDGSHKHTLAPMRGCSAQNHL